MKFIFLCIAVLSVSVFSAHAQMDRPDCGICWTVTDGTCSEDGTCNNWAGAESQTFTAPCTQTYKFLCKLDCEACNACGSCSRLVEVSTGNVVSRCQSTLDASGSCEWPCENKSYTGTPGYVSLVQGVQYRLDVMLQICPVTPSCGTCWNCTAKARIYDPAANCTAW